MRFFVLLMLKCGFVIFQSFMKFLVFQNQNRASKSKDAKSCWDMGKAGEAVKSGYLRKLPAWAQ